jgi:hypothetical protein
MFHCYNRPDVPISRVLAIGIYIKTSDTSGESDDFNQKFEFLLEESKDFSCKQFPGTQHEWMLLPPWVLDKSSSEFGTGELAAQNFYQAISNEIFSSLESSDSFSPYSSSIDDISGYDPTVVVFICFVHWGCERVMEIGNLKKYFIYSAAESLGRLDELDVIKRTGGSRSSFIGKMTNVQLNRLQCFKKPSSSSSSSSVGVGVGMITEEAWQVPDIPGCGAVVWHEGFGHALNLPHPYRRQQFCVMDSGMYQKKKLADLIISPSLLLGMRDGGLCYPEFIVTRNQHEKLIRTCAKKILELLKHSAMNRYGIAPKDAYIWLAETNTQDIIIIHPEGIDEGDFSYISSIGEDSITSASPLDMEIQLPRMQDYTLSEMKWYESQLAYDSSDTNRDEITMYRSARYTFQRVTWIREDGNCSTSPFLLLDVSRSIAILINSQNAYISTKGIDGPWSHFHNGSWLNAKSI